MNQDNPAQSPINPSLTGTPMVSPSPASVPAAPFPTTLPTVFGDDEEVSETKTVDLSGGESGSGGENNGATTSADLPAPKLDDLPPLEIPEVSPSGSGVPDAAGVAEVKAEEKGLPSLDDLDAMMQTGEAAKEEAAAAVGGVDLPPPSVSGGGESQSTGGEAAGEGAPDAAAPSLPSGLPSLDDLNAELPAAPIEPVATLPGAAESAEEKLPEIDEALPDLDSLSLKPAETEGGQEGAPAPTGELRTSSELPAMPTESMTAHSEGQSVEITEPVETMQPDLENLSGGPAFAQDTAPTADLPTESPAFPDDTATTSNTTPEALPSLTEAMQEGSEPVPTEIPLEQPPSPSLAPAPAAAPPAASPAFDLSNLSIDSLGQEATAPEIPFAPQATESTEPAEPTEPVIPPPAEPPALVASQPLAPNPMAPAASASAGLDFDLDNVANLDPKLIIDQQLSKLDQELAELQQKVGKMRQASENLRKEIEQKQYSAQVIDYALNSSMSRITECEQQKQDLMAAKAQIA